MAIWKEKIARLKANDKMGGVFMETLELLDILSTSPLSYPDLEYAIESVAASSLATQEHDRTLSQSQFNDMRRHYDSLRECCYVLVDAMERAARSFMAAPVANVAESAANPMLHDRKDNKQEAHAAQIPMESAVKEEIEDEMFADIKEESSIMPFDPSAYCWETKKEEEDEYDEEMEQFISSPVEDPEYSVPTTSRLEYRPVEPSNHAAKHKSRYFHCSYCKAPFMEERAMKIHERIHMGVQRANIGHASNRTLMQNAHLKSDFSPMHKGSLTSSKSVRTAPNCAPGTSSSFPAATENGKSGYYHCSYCNAPFVKLQGMKIHERSHRGGYICHICTKTFTTNSHLKAHVAIQHEQGSLNSYEVITSAPTTSIDDSDSIDRREVEKAPFISTVKCPTCTMTLSSQNALKRHMITHTGERPYKCTGCPATFAQKNSFTRHQERFHHF